jgi:hypothetical protein
MKRRATVATESELIGALRAIFSQANSESILVGIGDVDRETAPGVGI